MKFESNSDNFKIGVRAKLAFIKPLLGHGKDELKFQLLCRILSEFQILMMALDMFFDYSELSTNPLAVFLRDFSTIFSLKLRPTSDENIYLSIFTVYLVILTCIIITNFYKALKNQSCSLI
jgi:hypothetical protein